MPVIMEENKAAVQVWRLCRNQLIFANKAGGSAYPVDIRVEAVRAVMEMPGIAVQDQVGCLEKVQTLFSAWIQAVNELEDASAKSED
jgi:hypothetical protein